MRLSADLLAQSEQRTNALGERELILRGLLIPTIENLATTQDAYDTFDFTDNRITKVDNFPTSKRLSHLNLCQNFITSVDGKNLSRNVPNLSTFNLCYNQISSLNVLRNIGLGCKKLKFLFLNGNPVTNLHYYRLYTIYSIPSLQVLDFTKIKQKERDMAKRFAVSAAGAALQADIQMEARETTSATTSQSNNEDDSNTFVPGKGNTTKETFRIQFTANQKEEIRDMITNASCPEDVEKIEECVRRGEFPSSFASVTNQNGKRQLEMDEKEDDDLKKNRIEVIAS